jgi:hypothetical protein
MVFTSIWGKRAAGFKAPPTPITFTYTTAGGYSIPNLDPRYNRITYTIVAGGGGGGGGGASRQEAGGGGGGGGGSGGFVINNTSSFSPTGPVSFLGILLPNTSAYIIVGAGGGGGVGRNGRNESGDDGVNGGNTTILFNNNITPGNSSASVGAGGGGGKGNHAYLSGLTLYSGVGGTAGGFGTPGGSYGSPGTTGCAGACCSPAPAPPGNGAANSYLTYGGGGIGGQGQYDFVGCGSKNQDATNGSAGRSGYAQVTISYVP